MFLHNNSCKNRAKLLKKHNVWEKSGYLFCDGALCCTCRTVPKGYLWPFFFRQNQCHILNMGVQNVSAG